MSVMVKPLRTFVGPEGTIVRRSDPPQAWPEHVAEQHARHGYVQVLGPAEGVGPTTTKVVQPTSKDDPLKWNFRKRPAKESVVPVHTGGGYYDVGGERVRGKAAAEARAAELNGG